MLEGGFILLHRSILRWEWYGDLNTARLFIHLLLTMNYEPQRWQGIAVERGQRVASLAKLASGKPDVMFIDYLGRMQYTETERQGFIASRQHRKRRCRNTDGAKKILSANFTKTICDL